MERDAKMAELEFRPVEISVSLKKKVAETVAGPSQSMQPKPPDAPLQHLRSPMRKPEQFYKAKKRYVPKKNFFTREPMVWSLALHLAMLLNSSNNEEPSLVDFHLILLESAVAGWRP